MAGSPDFQSFGRPFAPPVVIFTNDLIGVGTVNYGPFGIGAMPYMTIAVNPGVGTLTARLVFEQPGVLTGWNVERLTYWRANEPGYYTFAVPSERLVLLAITGSVGGQTIIGFVANTAVPRHGGIVDVGGELLYNTNAALGAGATDTLAVKTYNGPARLTFQGVGAGTWTVVGSGLDRAGAIVSRWYVRTALAGDDSTPIILPPHINQLAVTNNAGVAAQYFATITAHVL